MRVPGTDLLALRSPPWTGCTGSTTTDYLNRLATCRQLSSNRRTISTVRLSPDSSKQDSGKHGAIHFQQLIDKVILLAHRVDLQSRITILNQVTHKNLYADNGNS